MTKNQREERTQSDLLGMTTDVVAAYVGNHQANTGELPAIINDVFAKLSTLQNGGAAPAEPEAPAKAAVPIKRSITPDYIICLEDGRKLKMLKRHLRTAFGLTPEQYRAKWGLPADYPMVAPNYAAKRSRFAKKFGLGKSRANRPVPLKANGGKANSGKGTGSKTPVAKSGGRKANGKSAEGGRARV